MKRMIAILLSTVVMASVFAACSTTTSFDRGYGYDYGNVSTTPNGRVNGRNGNYSYPDSSFDGSRYSNSPSDSRSSNSSNGNQNNSRSNSFGSNGYANNGFANYGEKSDNNGYYGRENNIMSDTETGTGMIGGR